MPKKTTRQSITIEFDGPVEPTLYANIACATWMQLRAICDAADIDFCIAIDGPRSLNKELNDHWDQFTRQAKWGDALLARRNYLAGIADTGGGCESIEIALPGNQRILVTDKDDLLAWERANHYGWFVGLYDEDEGMVCSTSTDDGSGEGLITLLDTLMGR